MIEIEPATVILSALKVAEDDGSTIVRVYNISNEPVEARIRLKTPYRSVERVDLNEENARGVASDGGVVRPAAEAERDRDAAVLVRLSWIIRCRGAATKRSAIGMIVRILSPGRQRQDSLLRPYGCPGVATTVRNWRMMPPYRGGGQ